jgi:uncharacterized protein YqfA (UPF0365 family)
MNGMAFDWPPELRWVLVGLGVAAVLAAIAVLGLFLKWGSYWFQAYMSGADISMANLVVMSLLKIDTQLIVTAKIMVRQAGLPIDRDRGMSTTRLQAHWLAGGDVMKVVKAIIVAHRAHIDLDFDRAAAFDLAGRDVLLAVQSSVSPRVIYCPAGGGDGRATLSAIALNGVELLVAARVTVRTNLEQLIGGATEETIVARVGQGIISAIGSAKSHMDVLAMPSQISAGAMSHGLDANTAFTIVSIDIAQIDVGENIGARLQSIQAEADIRIARALAEMRRAEAIAHRQQMLARLAKNTAALIRCETEVQAALADAFRGGKIRDHRRSADPNHKQNSTLRIHDERSAS